MFLISTFFVLLISLSACTSAGYPVGKLDTEEVYARAGNFTVTKGELWNELRWSASDVLNDKIEEVVIKDSFKKVELIIEKSYASLTDDEKKLFSDDFTLEDYNDLYEEYKTRLENYVIEDIYNFSFSSTDSYEQIIDLDEYAAKKLILKYSDEILSTYNISKVNGKTLIELCNEAAADESKRDNYFEIAKSIKELYYSSLAKELIAYEVLDKDIKEAYDNRDTDNEDDLGYFQKTDYTSKFKSEFANQQDLNLILIRFSTEDEFNSTLRSFGLKVYNNTLVQIINVDNIDCSFSEYCTFYDNLTTSDMKDSEITQTLTEVQILKLYIQMYNYLYGGYRDMIYDLQYADRFNNVDLRSITDEIRNEVYYTEEEEIQAVADIAKSLRDNAASYNVDTIFTREDIDDIDSSFNTYLYETLDIPYNYDENDDSISYSTAVQNYNSAYWIAYKLEEDENQYSFYDKNTVDDDLYDYISENEELKNEIEALLRQDKLTETQINSAITERTNEVKVNIYDEAMEISYAVSNSDYSKTYGSAPNSNVIATLTYNDKTWNLNLVEDLEDENALDGGVFDTLEISNGITTAIDILSRKVIKETKAYENTIEDIDDYKTQLEYVLTAFSNDYYSTNGYPSSMGKYNFMMVYFHTANIDDIVNNNYRVNGAAAKLLTNYNSDTLLNFFKTYTDQIYDNYFSISGQRLIVYLDADDDNVKDEVTEWSDAQKDAAKELVLKISDELASITGSHADTLTTIVSEINNSARAQFEDNLIAPENKWSKYRKLGLNVELETISASNSTTDLDFRLKERMYDIFHSEYYSINKTTPTEYIEDLTIDTILETDDGYNLLLITSADFQTSAKFTTEDDKLGIFDSIDVYYNDEYHTITDIYNDNEQLTLEQIRLYVLEYVTNSTSNLTPSTISNAITSFLSPVLTRYTGDETQRDIVIYLIETKTDAKIEFIGQNDRYQTILDINHKTADDYIDVYFEKDTTETLKTYENWWKDLQEIVSEILLQEGEDE